MLLNCAAINNLRILGRKTVELMARNQIEIGAASVWEQQDKFGLGFELITWNSRSGDQTTPEAYMWGGMYFSDFTIDPKEELIMLVFTNVQPIPTSTTSSENSA